MSLPPKRCRAASNLLRGRVWRADEHAEPIGIARALGREVPGSKEVTSRLGATSWLLAILLVACLGSAGTLQVRSEVPGVSQSDASLASHARPAQPSVLPRGLPQVVASETHRQKAIRGHDGTSFGIIPEEVPLPLVAYQGFAPVLRSDVLWSALVRAFEPRGPPSLIA